MTALDAFGGREAVISRLREAIRVGLSKLNSIVEAKQLLTYVGLKGELFPLLASGKCTITTEIIEALSDPLDLKIASIFGPCQLTDEQRRNWARRAREAYFCLVASSDGREGTGERGIVDSPAGLDLFILLTALAELREVQGSG